jgi:hypothetical protein
MVVTIKFVALKFEFDDSKNKNTKEGLHLNFELLPPTRKVAILTNLVEESQATNSSMP